MDVDSKRHITAFFFLVMAATVLARNDDDRGVQKDRAGHVEHPLRRGREICFVMSLFWEGGNPDFPPDFNPQTDFVDDRVGDAHETNFRFIYYSNHATHTFPNSSFPRGWEVRELADMPYHRMITQSRWPKFMGWVDPGLANCGVIGYIDAVLKVVAPASQWIETVEVLYECSKHPDARARNSIADKCTDARGHDLIGGGLMQHGHRASGPFEELRKIQRTRKDTQTNVKATMAWMTEQPDFREMSPMYHNNFFLYIPHDALFQEIACYFWSVYSAEKMSWRDQPLWGYVLNKFNTTPPDFPVPYVKGRRKNFVDSGGKVGFGGHRYADRNTILHRRNMQEASGEMPIIQLRWESIAAATSQRCSTLNTNGLE